MRQQRFSLKLDIASAFSPWRLFVLSAILCCLLPAQTGSARARAAADMSAAQIVQLITDLRALSKSDLKHLAQTEQQRLKAVQYFSKLRAVEDSAEGAVTIVLDAITLKNSVQFWRGPINDFLDQVANPEGNELTATKELLAAASTSAKKQITRALLKTGYSALAPGLLSWALSGDKHYQQTLVAVNGQVVQQIDVSAAAAIAAVQAGALIPAQADALLARLRSVRSAEGRIVGQLDALSSLLLTTYALRKGSEHDQTLLDNAFVDLGVYWTLTALSLPVGGWGGVAYKAEKALLDTIKATGRAKQDLEMYIAGVATSFYAPTLVNELFLDVNATLRQVAKLTARATPTGRIAQGQMTEQSGLLGKTQQAQLSVTVLNTGAREASFQAVTTYAQSRYLLPFKHAGYPVRYLVKSDPVTIPAGQRGVVPVHFVVNGDGAAPDKNAEISVSVLSQEAGIDLFIDQQAFTWQPGATQTITPSPSGPLGAPLSKIRIAFTQDYNVYLINADGSDGVTVTTRGTSSTETTAISYPWYQWSPDGKYLLLVRAHGFIHWDLLLVSSQGDVLRTLATNLDRSSNYPHWAVDSDQVAFTSTSVSTGKFGQRRDTVSQMGLGGHVGPLWTYIEQQGCDSDPSMTRLAGGSMADPSYVVAARETSPVFDWSVGRHEAIYSAGCQGLNFTDTRTGATRSLPNWADVTLSRSGDAAASVGCNASNQPNYCVALVAPRSGTVTRMFTPGIEPVLSRAGTTLYFARQIPGARLSIKQGDVQPYNNLEMTTASSAIWKTNTDGSNPVRLVQEDAYAFVALQLVPDGHSVVFSRVDNPWAIWSHRSPGDVIGFKAFYKYTPQASIQRLDLVTGKVSTLVPAATNPAVQP